VNVAWAVEGGSELKDSMDFRVTKRNISSGCKTEHSSLGQGTPFGVIGDPGRAVLPGGLWRLCWYAKSTSVTTNRILGRLISPLSMCNLHYKLNIT
jgi:hypothetical protein